jgi:hypothetical protein
MGKPALIGLMNRVMQRVWVSRSRQLTPFLSGIVAALIERYTLSPVDPLPHRIAMAMQALS